MGTKSLGYHVTNILLHSANALLVWLFLNACQSRRRGWPRCLCSAPGKRGICRWITELKNILMLLFCLLSLLAWLKFMDCSEKARFKWYFYAASLLLLAIALFSKATACTLPAALLLLLWLKGVPVTAKRLLQIVPFVLLAVAMGLLVVWWEKHHQGTVSLDIRINLIEKFLLAARALWFYLAKLFWPVDLIFSYPSGHRLDTARSVFVSCRVAGCGLCLWHWRNRIGGNYCRRRIFYRHAFSGSRLFPAFHLRIHLRRRPLSVYGLYRPISLAASSALLFINRFGAKTKAVANAAAFCLLCLLGLLTWRQCHIYENQEILWRDTIQKHPESCMAHNNLSIELRRRANSMNQSAIHARQFESRLITSRPFPISVQVCSYRKAR